MRYTDLVSASDIIVTKPGYGIVSECIAAGARCSTRRAADSPKYDVLVAAMPRYLRCHFIDHDALFGGRWRHALDAVMSLPTPPEKPTADGAEVAAAMISAQLS
jgi:L-arabinokinase